MKAKKSPPKWATPVRREVLVKAFEKYGNKCLLGHKVCPEVEHYLVYHGKEVWIAIPVDTQVNDQYGQPRMENGQRVTMPGYQMRKVLHSHQDFSNLYEQHSEFLIAGWKSEDRAEREWLWRREQQLLHKTHEERGWGRVFDPVALDQFMQTRRPFITEAVSVNPLTLQRVARIRVAGTGQRLFVNIMRHGKGKNARKKELRRAAQGVASPNHRLMQAAVDRFWLTRK